MDKCWFVLKQTHYPPPPDESLLRGIPDGPLCLGHLVPSLRQLDQVINVEEFKEFPRKMRVWRHDTIDFTLDQSTGRDVGVLGQASLPLLGSIPGVNGTASIGALFSKRVANHYQFSRLEQYIISPPAAWIAASIDTDEVREHIRRTTNKLGRWKMYLITGIAVARAGARTASTESKGIALHGGVGLQVPVMAEAGPELSLSASNCTRVAATHASDFIWAVRLAKITNNGPQATWTVETVFNRDSLLGRKATFTRGSDPADAAAFDPKPEIAGEGLSESEFEVTTVTTPGRRGEEQVHFITISDEDEERMIKSVMRESPADKNTQLDVA